MQLNDLRQDIIKSLKDSGRNASGKTANSMRVEVKERGGGVTGILYGSEVLDILEYGRSPSKGGQKGNRTWEKELREWMQIIGISQDAFYPIWRKINRDGYKGTPGLISNPIDKFNKGLSNGLKGLILESVRDGIKRN